MSHTSSLNRCAEHDKQVKGAKMKANTYSRRGGVGGKKASTAPAPADDDSFDDFVVEKKKPSGTGKKKNTCSAKGKSKNDKPQVKSLDY